MPDNTPQTLNCPSCGAPLEYDGTSSIVRCRFCKNIALIPGLPAAREATPRASLEEVRILAQNGSLVEAIRRYRVLYGVGPKEARNAVDALAAGKVVEVHRVFSGPLSAEETGRVLDEVKELLRSGDKPGAIRHYREVNDVSFTQAAEVIAQVEAALTGIPAPARTQIPGLPSYAPPTANKKFIATLLTLTVILVVAGGLLAFFLSGQGTPFGPRLFASGPIGLVSAASPGASPDVVALFYNPDADNRQVGLVDGTTGKLRWHAEPLNGDGFADAIADGGDLLYAASGMDLLAYRKSDGSHAWQAQMPDRLNYGDVPLLVSGGRVLTINADQSIQAYDALTGSPAWNRRLAGYDRSLRLMGSSLVVLDYTPNTFDYSLYVLDPADGSEQRVLTPSCSTDPYSSDALEVDSGLLYLQVENALILVYDPSPGCVQRIDFTTGKVSWQTVSTGSFSFSPYGFNKLLTGSILFFTNGSQLLSLDKSTGALQTVLDNADYDFVPLAISGDSLLVRARRTRGTERFELWGVNPVTGAQRWTLDLKGAAPVDPPNEMSGLVDDTDSGWTWKLTPAGFLLIKFQAAPNQLVLDTLNPADGSQLSELTVPLKAVTGDFYSIPTVVGWQGTLVYLDVDSEIYALDVTTGKIVFHY